MSRRSRKPRDLAADRAAVLNLRVNARTTPLGFDEQVPEFS
ncbi:hypothetical protein [Candidatus Frankia nodulisporulans]